jgi:hypothetical protein
VSTDFDGSLFTGLASVVNRVQASAVREVCYRMPSLGFALGRVWSGPSLSNPMGGVKGCCCYAYNGGCQKARQV